MIRALALLAVLVAGGPTLGQERPWTPLPSPASATCPGGLCQPHGLGTFFDALARGGPIRIVQFGDSHTAGGHITGSLEWRLSARFPRREVRLTSRGVVGDTLRGLQAHEPLLDPGQPTPDLVILAYGTNEGFDDALDPAAYDRLMRDQLDRLRRLYPRTALLVLGPPEAMRGEGGGTCVGDPEGRWRAPVMLGVVRDVQHRVSADMGVAFWDWRGRMGGACSAHALSMGVEPLMRGDHVHFTGAGGDWIGGLLFDDLMSAYARHAGRGGR